MKPMKRVNSGAKRARRKIAGRAANAKRETARGKIARGGAAKARIASLKASADNALIITTQLAQITYKINNGHGAVSRLLGDSSFANNFSKTMTNLKNSSEGLSENMEAAKHNFLLRGYFRKKKKQEEKKKKESEEKKEQR